MAIFGFIGIGNMGAAMLNGALKAFKKSDFIYTDVSKVRLNQVKAETGIDYVTNHQECIEKCKYIVLAVKPQYYQEVLPYVKRYMNYTQVIVSIAPGITIQSIKEATSEEAKVIRLMPNTPALIGQGMTAVSYSDNHFSDEEKSVFLQMLESFGEYEMIPEQLMNAVVAANGSSPAFVYMMIEALADGVVKYGIPRKQALHLVAKTIQGSAGMVLETGRHPAELKDMVCSPAGTTIEGVSALEQAGFRTALIQAVDAVTEKSKRLGRV